MRFLLFTLLLTLFFQKKSVNIIRCSRSLIKTVSPIQNRNNAFEFTLLEISQICSNFEVIDTEISTNSSITGGVMFGSEKFEKNLIDLRIYTKNVKRSGKKN